MLMISFDDEDGPSIYRIDGYYRGVKVCAIFDLLEDLSSFRCGFEEKSCQKQTIRNAIPQYLSDFWSLFVQGISVGVKHQPANAFLEKKLKKVSDLDKDATIQVSRRIFLLFSRVQVLALYCWSDYLFVVDVVSRGLFNP